MPVDFNITGDYLKNGVPIGGTNPTSGFMPINNNGVFVDSKFVSYGVQNNTRQLQPQFISNKFGIFTDANNSVAFVTPNSGIEIGVANINADAFGADFYVDSSIVSGQAQTGFFGNPLYIKTQPQVFSFLSPSDTQVTQISIVPGNFFTGQYGIGIKTEDPNCPLTVFNPDGFPAPGHYNHAIARFTWDMGGVVFPNVPESNRGMMMPENGMVIYNTTTNKLQVVSNGTWVNLH
jgi:hypothetical protein